jgi:hypothetical protein
MRRRRLAIACLLAACLARPALAGDVTLFAARVNPTENWGTGYGAALSSTWFTALNLEAEAARLPGARTEDIMTTFTGSAFLAPPLGKIVPYGGVGIGYYRQSRNDRSDSGFIHTLAFGAKLKLGLLLVRGEWRRLTISEPMIQVDSRVSAGLGINF